MSKKEEEMKKIKQFIENCKKCSLWKMRNKPVVGTGSSDAELLFIGEAPGSNEDLQGKPFVGRAGKILDELIESIGLKREDVFIANILKCRPPDNRNPLKAEINACAKYLDKQIEIIKPKIIAPLGNFACSFIFEKYGLKFDKIGNVHGKIFQVKTNNSKVKIIPLYHPAVVTYNSKKKKVLIKDFEAILKE